jgi:hypothetical protein
MASEHQSGLFNRSSIAVFAEAYEGLGDVHGILSFDGRSLKLSFQTADALFGLLKSKTTELSMPLEAVEQLDFGLGWFWLMPYVELRLNDFSMLSQVPSAKHGRLKLRVRFADRHLARRFAEKLRFARAEHTHQQIEGSMPYGSHAAEQPLPPLPQAAAVATVADADESPERKRELDR